MARFNWGAIFDWDGVILDSSRHHEESWKRLASETGFSLQTDQFKRGFGMKNEKIIPEILGWARQPAEIQMLSNRKEELYRQIIQEWGITPLPGVETWLKELKAAGVPCVIASSTHRLNIQTILPQLNLEAFFMHLVTAEDVHHGKPHPEVFLKAAQAIRIPPNRSVVFEDALVGIEAACSAEMKVIGVTTTHSASHLRGASLVVPQLDFLSLEKIWMLFDP